MQHMHYIHIWVEKCTCNKVQCAVHAVGACVLRWRFVLYTNRAPCKRTHTFRMCNILHIRQKELWYACLIRAYKEDAQLKTVFGETK